MKIIENHSMTTLTEDVEYFTIQLSNGQKFDCYENKMGLHISADLKDIVIHPNTSNCIDLSIKG